MSTDPKVTLARLFRQNPGVVDTLEWLSSRATLGALALLLVPTLLAALAYGSLLFRVEAPLQRYRVAVVSLSLVMWFGGPIAAQLAGVSESGGWDLASRFTGLAAALAILLAYRPPQAVLRRLERADPGGARLG